MVPVVPQWQCSGTLTLLFTEKKIVFPSCRVRTYTASPIAFPVLHVFIFIWFQLRSYFKVTCLDLHSIYVQTPLTKCSCLNNAFLIKETA